jgi:hypothetical protein
MLLLLRNEKRSQMKSPERSGRQAALLLLLGMAGAFQNALANTQPVKFVHRILDCGAITVTSDTQLASHDDDLTAQGISQIIRPADLSDNRTVTLPIFQHWSKDKDLQGAKILDGLVWAFGCAMSRSGEPYVELFWSCTNPYAKTCQAAMDLDNEWEALYDRHGHSIPADPNNMTMADERRVKQLGLWQSFIQNDLDKNGGFTYFSVQVDRNGHIR